VGALQQRLDAVERRAGIEASLVVEGEPELDPRVEEQLYRIAEEALSNALKHAVPSSIATTIRFEGSSPDQYVVLEVVDDGVGFDVRAVGAAGGLGLVSMRQRAEKIGGRLTVHSAPGKGTMIKMRMGRERSG
jgi:signal transduction histidine kinase